MPVGTKLQGHIESVKSKFGFIRCVNAELECPSGSSVTRQAIIQLLHMHASQAGHPAHVLHSAEHSPESCLLAYRVSTASEPIFFHMSELRVDGRHLSNGTTPAPQAAQDHSSSTASQSEEQPASEVRGLLCLQNALSPYLHPKPHLAKVFQVCKEGEEQSEPLRNLANFLEQHKACMHACMPGGTFLPWVGSEEQKVAL